MLKPWAAWPQSTRWLTGAVAAANLVRARLFNADLTGAELVGADLTETVALITVDLTEAILGGVRWPGDTQVPEGWWLDEESGRRRQAGFNPGPSQAV